MTWESIVLGVLQGFSNFVNSLVGIIGGSLNPVAIEGLSFLFLLGIVLRVLDGGVKLPKVKVPKLKRKDDEDEDEWEYIRVRRQRR